MLRDRALQTLAVLGACVLLVLGHAFLRTPVPTSLRLASAVPGVFAIVLWWRYLGRRRYDRFPFLEYGLTQVYAFWGLAAITSTHEDLPNVSEKSLAGAVLASALVAVLIVLAHPVGKRVGARFAPTLTRLLPCGAPALPSLAVYAWVALAAAVHSGVGAHHVAPEAQQLVRLAAHYGPLFAYMAWRDLRHDRRGSPLLVASTVVVSGAGFLTGMMEAVLRPVLAALVLYLVFQRRIPWRLVVAGALIVFVVNPAKHYYRQAAWDDTRESHVATDPALAARRWVDAFQAAWFSDTSDPAEHARVVAERLNELSIDAEVMEKTPLVVPHDLGRGWAAIPLLVLPRFIYRGKPNVTQQYNDRFNLLFGFQGVDSMETTTLAFPLVADGWWNFGWAGVVAAGIAVGVLLGFLAGALPMTSWAVISIGTAAFVEMHPTDYLAAQLLGAFLLVCGIAIACWGATLAGVLFARRGGRGGARPAWVALALVIGLSACGSRATDPAATAVDVGTLAADEEFVGPFPSWRTVKAYGATGDGVSDDTAAIQRALSDLKSSATGVHAVLYFPAGTYRVTRTLETSRREHQDYLGASIVGEDPRTTVLAWDGAAGADMLHLDAWYARVSRLTFDGRGKADVGLYRGDTFSTYCELSDLVFRDMQVGIQLGSAASAGQAEQVILRSRFQRLSSAGVRTANWNSLDVWVWYGRFEDCAYAVYNVRGNFHVFESVFLRSRRADVATENLQAFALVGNTSVGSRTFADWSRLPRTSGAQVLVLRNRIYDTLDDAAIVTGSAGPWVLLDNVIRSRAGQHGPAVRLTAHDQVLVGNTFTVSNPIQVADGTARVRTLDQRIVRRADLPPPGAELPPTPPDRRRKVFEVTARSAEAVQAQVDAAAAEPAGTRPVVHLPKGRYRIARSIVVPPGKDLQIVGDGASGSATHLEWTPAGAARGPVLLLSGPSRTIVRDLSISARGANGAGASALVVTNADQPGGRIYADQLNAGGAAPPPSAATQGLYVNGVENADVTLLGFEFAFAETGILVRGGPRRSASEAAPGQVTCLGGVSSHSGILYDVVDGGELVAGPAWYEGNWPDPKKIDLRSSGALTLFGLQLAAPTDALTPAVQVHGHRGTLALLASPLQGGGGSDVTHRFLLDGRGDAMKVLSLGNMFWATGPVPGREAYVWLDRTSPRAEAALVQCVLNGPGMGQRSSDVPDVANQVKGSEPSDAFLRDALRPLRSARIEPPVARPPGATDVRLFRVLCEAEGASAVEIRR